MSDPYLDADVFDDELTGDETAAVDPLEEAFWENPLGAIVAAAEQGATQAEARIAEQIRVAEATIQAQMADRNASEAVAAMTEKYGESWAELGDAVASRLGAEGAAGRLPTDAQGLAYRMEEIYLAERERSRPSRAQQDAEYAARVQAAADATRNPWTS
jgi:hypothetical protein